MYNKTLIKESEIHKDLIIRTYHTEEKIILEICCMGGKFMIVKNYPLDREGEKACESFVDRFKCVDDVFDYFKMKRKNK